MSSAKPVWTDPRVRRGFEAQLANRDRLLAGGARRAGWKVAFGAPAALSGIGISAPLVGFLNEDTRHPDGASIAVGDWSEPVFEAEIAIHIGVTVPPQADAIEAAACINGLSAAIEVADIDEPAGERLEQVLAGDIYHRGYVLGAISTDHVGGSASGVRGRVYRDGEQIARQDDPRAFVGDLVEVTRHVAALLGEFDLPLAAGEVILAGSVVPPIEVAPDQRLRCEFDSLGSLGVGFEA